MHEYSVRQAAQLLGMTKAGIIKAIQKGHIRSEKQSGCYRIKKADFESYQNHRPQRGRASQYSPEENATIKTIALTHPKALGLPLECWRLRTLRDYLATRGINLSTGKISDIIREARIRDLVIKSHRGKLISPPQTTSPQAN